MPPTGNSNTKRGAVLSVGDRDLPLEAELSEDCDRRHPAVGRVAEISPIAGGLLQPYRGKKAEIMGVLSRLGQVVGYEVKVGDSATLFGTTKDVFSDRCVLEDIQVQTPTSAAVRDALSHFAGQRDYWHTRIDGLENLCFELASATPLALVECLPWGWKFLIPDPMPNRHTVVECHVAMHPNFWTLGVMVYPNEGELSGALSRIPDHWDRTFAWTRQVAEGMTSQYDYPWVQALENIEARRLATQKILGPLVKETMTRALQAKRTFSEDVPHLPAGSVSTAFSNVRLKAGTVGLTEPPTDRRPYTVTSISPEAAKKEGYIEQVVLHECIHVVVASTGGPPHNEEFLRLAEMLRLAPEHRG